MEQPGYVRDIEELLGDYCKTEAVDFASFRNLWRSKNFSFIHEGRPKGMNLRAYQQILYSAALGHLGEGKPLKLQIGVLYALHTLYETQLAQPKTLIYLSTADVLQLRALLRQIKERQLADAFQVMRQLALRDTCLLGAVACSAPAAVDRASKAAEAARKKVRRTREKVLGQPEVKEHFESSLAEKLPLGEVDSWQMEYSMAKDIVLPGVSSGVVATQPSSDRLLANQIGEHARAWDSHKAATLRQLLPHVVPSPTPPDHQEPPGGLPDGRHKILPQEGPSKLVSAPDTCQTLGGPASDTCQTQWAPAPDTCQTQGAPAPDSCPGKYKGATQRVAAIGQHLEEEDDLARDEVAGGAVSGEALFGHAQSGSGLPAMENDSEVVPAPASETVPGPMEERHLDSGELDEDMEPLSVAMLNHAGEEGEDGGQEEGSGNGDSGEEEDDDDEVAQIERELFGSDF